MNLKEFSTKIKEKWQMILAISFIVTAGVFSITAFISPRYSSEIGLIVIQKQPSYSVDAFSAAKSAEYLSEILSKVIYTDSFLNDIYAAPFEVKRAFSPLPEKRKRQWEKTVDIKKINNTGILEITIFDQSKEEAEKIAQAVAWTYGVRGQKYHGGGDRVKVELIDGPITSEKPTNPNLLLTTLLGLVVGLAGSLSLIYFANDFDLKIFKKAKSKKDQSNRMEEISRKILDLKNKFQIKTEDLRNDYDQKIFLEVDEKASRNKDVFKEGVRVIRDEEINREMRKGLNADNFSEEKKSGAPQNLPYLDYEVEKPTAEEFVDIEELEKENVDKSENKGENSEPTENEVKDRLNKLLKGDL